MKNVELQNFGVVEMDAIEVVEVDGGGCPGIDWLMGYNDIMSIENDWEREAALSIFFSIWGVG